MNLLNADLAGMYLGLSSTKMCVFCVDRKCKMAATAGQIKHGNELMKKHF
jgi:hypothetical protein